MKTDLLCSLRQHGLLRCMKATSAVEFALVAPILIILAGAATDLGNAFQESIRLGSAVRAGAQFAAAHSENTGGIVAAVSSAVAGWGGVNVTVDPMQCQCLDPASGVGTGAISAAVCSLTCPGGMARYVTVHAVRDYTPLFPASDYVTFNAITQVRADVTVRVQ
jgi:Flp pilus assembly protein TadG